MKPDYCTAWFEGGWAHCCKAHDEAYATGVDRALADAALKVCVEQAGYPVMAIIMSVGVTLFGWIYYRRSRRLD